MSITRHMTKHELWERDRHPLVMQSVAAVSAAAAAMRESDDRETVETYVRALRLADEVMALTRAEILTKRGS